MDTGYRPNGATGPRAGQRALDQAIEPDPTEARILVVDDEPRNREIIRAALTAEGYTVVEAGNGVEALCLASTEPMDVILLDVRMPGMDGVEACSHFKADPETAMIPVLIVTAHDSRVERLRCIRAGASDFLRKPLDLADLRLRVRNALASKRLYDELEAKYRRVVELEGLRDNLVHMIAHDIKSPLFCIRGNLELLTFGGPEKLGVESMENVIGALEATDVVLEMIRTMLDLSRLESEEMPIELRSCVLTEVVRGSLSRLGPRAERVLLRDREEKGRIDAFCDPPLLTRVLVNLLDNALDFSPGDSPVTVSFSVEDGFTRISVSDRGPGIGAPMIERVFDKFCQGESGTPRRPGSAGLGLAFCKLAVEAQRGRIGAESSPGGGSTFWIDLPRMKPTTLRACG